MNEYISQAKEAFGKLLEEQLARCERMKSNAVSVDYAKLDKLIIGVCPGDGIGPPRGKRATADGRQQSLRLRSANSSVGCH